MIEQLNEKIMWVTISFADNSVKLVKTTLNKNILASYGVTPKAGYFYDLRHGEFVKFRQDACKIDVTEEQPVFDDEVINFANRFI